LFQPAGSAARDLPMSMEIINGYVCRNCTDVELAKRGVDPAKPKDDPKSPSYDPAQAKADHHGPAFQLSDALKAASAIGSAASGLPPVNATGDSGHVTPPGTHVDISA
jgi:hypothetical protein